MYPNLYYYFKDVFGIEIPQLYYINTFGFFFALAFLSAYYIYKIEVKRKEKINPYPTFKINQIIGAPATTGELLVNFLIGFILGYKILHLFFFVKTQNINIQQFLFSGQGTIWLGLLVGTALSFNVWYSKNKKKLPKPEKKILEIPHSKNVLPIFYLTIISSIIGAKIFHNLEYWEDFTKDPFGALFSFGGLTFFGGIIVSFFTLLYYLRKHKIPILQSLDSIAIAIILAYGVGRLGCHFAGDGDWGIINSAYVTSTDGKAIHPSNDTLFLITLEKYKSFYTAEFGSLEKTNHTSFSSSLLPTFLEANAYPQNVINSGVPSNFSQSNKKYNRHLPIPVFPTPLYESLLSILTFFILFALRKKISTISGLMLSIYLMWNGIERFLIEKIRINSYYQIGGLKFTQAELISVLFFVVGLILCFILIRKKYVANKS